MKNRVCEILNIKKPIIQAPMLWVTSAELVAAVGESGGLGTYGINGGYSTKVTTVEETTERIRQQFRKIRSLTDKPFAFNYMMSPETNEEELEEINVFSSATLKVALEEGLKVVVAVGEVNTKEIKMLKEHGLTVILRAMYPTVENSVAAEAAGADIIVATGFDEGGSAPINPIGTMSIVPMIADAVKVPVMAAGGIVDSRGVNASFALGAEGVFVGTAFITSTENPASDIAKQAIVNAEGTDTVTFRTLLGYERCLPSKPAVEKYEKFMDGQSDDDLVENMTSGFLQGFIHGQLDNGYASVSSAISMIKEVRPCAEIIEEMFKDLA